MAEIVMQCIHNKDYKSNNNRVSERVRSTPCSKKVGCPVKLLLYEIATFPDYMLEKHSEWSQRKMAEKLKRSLQMKDMELIGRVERKIILSIPGIAEHRGHVIGEVGLRKILDRLLFWFCSLQATPIYQQQQHPLFNVCCISLAQS